jgi:hypothetical protein
LRELHEQVRFSDGVLERPLWPDVIAFPEPGGSTLHRWPPWRYAGGVVAARPLAVIGALGALIALGGACGAFQGSASSAGTDAGADDASAAGGGGEGGPGGGATDSAAPACQADLTSDRANCGWCGHDCRGAECNSGECAPSLIASGYVVIKNVVLGSANVAWLDVNGGNQTVWTCPKAGCGGAEAAALVTNPYINALGAEGSTLFATYGPPEPLLVSCPMAGCPVGPTRIASGLGNILSTAIVVDATAIRWVETEGGVFQCPKTGACVPLAISGPSSGGSLLQEWGGKLYWVEAGNVVARCDPSQCGTPDRLGGGGPMMSMAVGASGVFWTDSSDNGSVIVLPPGSAQPTPFAPQEYRPTGVITDDGTVYWFDGNAAAVVIKRAPMAGGPPVAIASKQDSVVQLAVDDQYLYWATRTSVWRVAK